jgi:hypothetical protein
VARIGRSNVISIAPSTMPATTATTAGKEVQPERAAIR